MAKAKETTAKAKKPSEKKEDAVAARLRLVEAFLKPFGFNVDLDGDGKVGRVNVALLAILIVGVSIGVALSRDWVNYTANESGTGTATWTTDDAGVSTLTTDVISAGTQTVSKLTVNGDIELANDDTIDNATADNVRITTDGTNANLANVIIESDAGVSDLADNDYADIIFKAYDSTTAKTSYASVRLKATDITGATEDGAVILRPLVAGTATDILTADASGVTLNNGAIIANPNADTVTVTEANINLAGAVDISGATTATNITMDTGSTLAIDLLTVDGVSGWSGITTSAISPSATNLLYWNNGVVTNVTVL